MERSETVLTDEVEATDEVEVEDIPKMYWLPENVYIALKWTTLIALPAVGVFYQGLAGIWGLPLSEEISQTCSFIALFLGTLIGVSAIANKVRS